MSIRKYGLFIALFIINCSYIQAQECASIQWVNDSISGKYIEKLAILIPVKFENLPNNFVMQLDLGANETVMYGNTVESFFEKIPILEDKIDTTKFYKNQRGEYPYLNGVRLNIGNMRSCKIDVGYLKGYGYKLDKDSINTKSEIRIGTIGADIFKDKILIINYPLNEICINDSTQIDYSEYSFVSFEFVDENKDNRLLLPFEINGKTQRLLFDTGASMFELSTIENNASMICENEISDSLVVNSWGEKMTMIGKKSNKTLNLGDKIFPQIMVYYDKANKYDFFYESNNIFGLTGNALFLNNVVLIDYKNKLFGIK